MKYLLKFNKTTNLIEEINNYSAFFNQKEYELRLDKDILYLFNEHDEIIVIDCLHESLSGSARIEVAIKLAELSNEYGFSVKKLKSIDENLNVYFEWLKEMCK